MMRTYMRIFCIGMSLALLITLGACTKNNSSTTGMPSTLNVPNDAPSPSGAVVSINSVAAPGYKLYINTEYGYSFEYPDFFTEMTRTDNASGPGNLNYGDMEWTMISSPNSIALVKTLYNSAKPDDSLDSQYQDLLQYSGITSEAKGDNWCAISGTDTISPYSNYNTKVIMSGHTSYKIQFTYPADQKDFYQPIAQHVLDTFRILTSPAVSTSTSSDTTGTSGWVESAPAAGYQWYSNSTYGCSFEYPDTFTMTSPSGGESRTDSLSPVTYNFTDGIANLSVSRVTFGIDHALDLYYGDAIQQKGVTATGKGDDWYSLSSINGSQSSEIKVIMPNHQMYTVTFSYPASQKTIYDPMAQHVLDTIRIF